jgi:hypothetical protein
MKKQLFLFALIVSVSAVSAITVAEAEIAVNTTKQQLTRAKTAFKQAQDQLVQANKQVEANAAAAKLTADRVKAPNMSPWNTNVARSANMSPWDAAETKQMFENVDIEGGFFKH